ncbi:MAG: hypothetical protein ACFE8A_11835 [Candidatus Hodarchaeota archaeon]
MTESIKRDPFEGLYEVYLLFFEETKGNFPFFIYPDETIKNNTEKMRPINIHTIWWMDMKDQAVMDHVDLEYGDKMYIARKFLTLSKRKKKGVKFDNYTPETIIIILTIPNDLYIFGGALLNQLTINIIKNFEGKLYHVIESEIAKEKIIKTPEIKKIIDKGDVIKERMKDIVLVTCKHYFSSVIKKNNLKSIKQQKALSYLSLKGIDFSYLAKCVDNEEFSNIRLFDIKMKSENRSVLRTPLTISNVKINEGSNELEIIVRNKTEKELNNVLVKITQLKEFYESEIMGHKIDQWFPEEELLFISPILPNINDYNLFIKDDDNHLLSKKINFTMPKF